MTDVTWALSSCVLILTVIVLRAAFGKRMRPGLRYALWGLVLLRLLIPTQLFAAPWGVSAELPERMTERNVYVLPVEQTQFPGRYEISGEPYPEDMMKTWNDANTRFSGVDGDMWTFTRYAASGSLADMLRAVWLAGVGVNAIVFLVSNLRFYLRLRKRRRSLDVDCPLRVYAVESLSSSCLFGSAIYVAAKTAADETRLRHVLAHELSHHRHGDNVWTLLRCVALSLHWYNPLVWWAAALARQDSELCADAGALKRLGEDERESYGATLIELSARRAPKASLLGTATTVTNGKKSLKERVTMIARRPRMTAAVVIAVVLIAAVATGCAFAGAAAAPMTEEEALNAEEGANTDAGQTARWEADFDGDGTAERLVLDTQGLLDRNAGGFWLEDLNGNQMRFMGEIATAHAGWRTVALTELDGRTYLLEYGPTMYQGEATYSYILGGIVKSSFTEEDQVAFSANPDGMANNDRTEMARFQARANELWSHSRLLFTTDQEVLAHLYDAGTGKVVETNGWYYIAGEGETVRYYETMYGLMDDEAETLFSSIAGEYWFLSGAGGWHTEMRIGSDGAFTGRHQDHDANMVSLCDFSGRFGDVRQINGYTYSMRLTELTAEQTEGEELGMIDGVRGVGSLPYGIEGADEIFVYLPGTPVSALPEDFLRWYCAGLPYGREQIGDTLPMVGLYGAENGYGWFARGVLDLPVPESNG